MVNNRSRALTILIFGAGGASTSDSDSVSESGSVGERVRAGAVRLTQHDTDQFWLDWTCRLVLLILIPSQILQGHVQLSSLYAWV